MKMLSAFYDFCCIAAFSKSRGGTFKTDERVSNGLHGTSGEQPWLDRKSKWLKLCC